MTKSKELMVGIRIHWLSLKLQYLKALIKIYSLIGEFRGSKENKSLLLERPQLLSEFRR